MSHFLLKADSTIQGLLLLGIFVLAPTIIFPLLLLLPLGAWQLSSALVKGVAWRSRLHLTYFGLAAAYCLALWAWFSGTVEVSFSFAPVADFWDNEAWGIFFVVVVPLAAAAMYWKISCDDIGRCEEKLV